LDVACPLCGPDRRTPANRTRKVLRLWSSGDGFISYYCARCCESGFARDGERRETDLNARARIRAEIEQCNQDAAREQSRKAAWLWRGRMPIRGSLAEIYLRESRCISCPLPPTLAFLPVRGDHPPAMIAAFGMAREPEPGVLTIDGRAVRSVHLTRLKPEGSGKIEDGSSPKIMLGRSLGLPIVLAPMNDLLGLSITEGIEDALSIHQATGLGAWAAGSANRLPALADAVPDCADCVSILVDDDEAGRVGAAGLARGLRRRGIHVELVRAAP
jgi:Toprim domain